LLVTGEASLKRVLWLFLLVFLTVAACAPQPAVLPPDPTIPPPHTPAPATATPMPSSTPVPTSTPTPDPYLAQICSPLEGFAISDLPTIISNPYDPPLPGMDDGHHGTDFSFYTYPALGLDKMKGLPIHAVLDGTVISVNRNIPPYGYTVIIETPLDQLSPDWRAVWQLPQPAPLQTPVSALSCPAFNPPTGWQNSPHSLYLLYAHMDQPPAVQPGQTLTCGQPIGVVGTSGASVNDHLHLEARVGPAGAQFTGLGHYDTAATEEERLDYCTWRISGWFQLVDPLLLLTTPITQP
jgi:murein DD-endopeptidase MepM/ murein hydrolase activator NlpD